MVSEQLFARPAANFGTCGIIGFLHTSTYISTRLNTVSLTCTFTTHIKIVAPPRTTSSRSLPEDLIMEIFTWLPFKSLVRFKSVSKSLLNLIISPEFVSLNIRRSRIKNSTLALLRSENTYFAWVDLEQPQRPVIQFDIHPDVINLLGPSRYENYQGFYIPNKIIGICKGVVCIRKLKEFILYNPATGAYKQVPIPNIFLRKNCFIYRDEFVYDCISDDFKIFRFIERFVVKTRMDSETSMYNLKDNSWSNIRSPPLGKRLHNSCNHVGGNYLYWLEEDRFSTAKVLVCFDVSSNKYEEMLLVPACVLPSPYPPILGVLNGRLHITSNGKKPEIWMLNDDCWSLVFRCSGWEYPVKRCLFYSKDGRKIFLALRKKVPKFICCDLDSQTTSVVDILGLPEGVGFKAMSWMESHAPLA